MRSPNHYSGDGSVATPEVGEFKMTAWIDGIVKAIRGVEADEESLKLQNEFFEKAKHPGHTPLGRPVLDYSSRQNSQRTRTIFHP
jgi:creatinine amidohydrolase